MSSQSKTNAGEAFPRKEGREFLDEAWRKRDQMTRELYVRYPRLLRPDSVLQYLAYGPGWFRLIDEFLAGVNERLPDDLASRFCIDQIKEKFGRMRIHYCVLPPETSGGEEAEMVSWSADDAPDFPFAEINALRAIAEQRSHTTCFFCGSPGLLRQVLWTRVTCDACEELLEPAP